MSLGAFSHVNTGPKPTGYGSPISSRKAGNFPEPPGPTSAGPRAGAPSTGGGILREHFPNPKPPHDPRDHAPIVGPPPAPTPTPPDVTSVDRSRLDGPDQMDNPFWTGPRRVPAGAMGNMGRPHTTGNMGDDNVRWQGPGHYWRGYPACPQCPGCENHVPRHIRQYTQILRAVRPA